VLLAIHNDGLLAGLLWLVVFPGSLFALVGPRIILKQTLHSLAVRFSSLNSICRVVGSKSQYFGEHSTQGDQLCPIQIVNKDWNIRKVLRGKV